MSIFAEIDDRLKDGSIIELVPRVSGPRYRRLLMTSQLHAELTGEHVSSKIQERYAQIEADLEVFINRRLLGPDYIFGLSPWKKGVWEIKSLQDPQWRVFGLFIAKDLFLSTHCERRSRLGSDIKWHDQISDVEAEWQLLFPARQPLVSNDVNVVITGAMDEQYFR
jgi:hypothetical protein